VSETTTRKGRAAPPRMCSATPPAAR
jgi:hypothetical protein